MIMRQKPTNNHFIGQYKSVFTHFRQTLPTKSCPINASDKKHEPTKTITVILLLIPALLNAQSFTVSGQLEQGHVQDIQHLAITKGEVSVHYFRAVIPNYGISYSPLKWKGISAGVIATRRGLPSPIDMPVNFILDFGFDINGIRISWTHISNGFGLWHRPNHGFDAISFTINH